MQCYEKKERNENKKHTIIKSRKGDAFLLVFLPHFSRHI